MRRKAVALAIVMSLVVVVAGVFLHFEKRQVLLKEVGTLSIIPPGKNVPEVWQSSRGDGASDEIESIKVWLDLIDKEPHKINTKAVSFDPGKFYYFGVGCKIEEVKYFKNIHNSRWYHVDSVKRNPIKPYNQIFVYEGDVPVADIKP